MKLTIQQTINNVTIDDKSTVITISGVGIQGSSGSASSNMPAGGSTNMLLAKNSNNDYDYKWTSELDDIVIDANMNGGYF